MMVAQSVEISHQSIPMSIFGWLRRKMSLLLNKRNNTCTRHGLPLWGSSHTRSPDTKFLAGNIFKTKLWHTLVRVAFMPELWESRQHGPYHPLPSSELPFLAHRFIVITIYWQHTISHSLPIIFNPIKFSHFLFL